MSVSLNAGRPQTDLPAGTGEPAGQLQSAVQDVTINRTYAHTWKGHFYQPEGVELARSVATDLGLASVEVRTRAGHDSTNMKDRVPTVMLFVPSVDGISHAEAEFTHDEDLCRGTHVLTETLARMLQGRARLVWINTFGAQPVGFSGGALNIEGYHARCISSRYCADSRGRP
jgi:hypothetical protein